MKSIKYNYSSAGNTKHINILMEKRSMHIYFQHLEMTGESDSVPLPVVLIISCLLSKRKCIAHNGFTTLTSIWSKMTDNKEVEGGHLHKKMILMLWLILVSA